MPTGPSLNDTLPSSDVDVNRPTDDIWAGSDGDGDAFRSLSRMATRNSPSPASQQSPTGHGLVSKATLHIRSGAPSTAVSIHGDGSPLTSVRTSDDGGKDGDGDVLRGGGGAGAVVRLHRKSVAVSRSGVPRAQGVVNIPIPVEFVREVRAARLAAGAGRQGIAVSASSSGRCRGGWLVGCVAGCPVGWLVGWLCVCVYVCVCMCVCSCMHCLFLRS